MSTNDIFLQKIALCHGILRYMFLDHDLVLTILNKTSYIFGGWNICNFQKFWKEVCIFRTKLSDFWSLYLKTSQLPELKIGLWTSIENEPL